MHDMVDRPAPTVATRWQRSRRPLLMIALPLLLALVGGYLWWSGGRSVSTDNAYVEQDKISISSDVTGRVLAVNVTESQHVPAGQLLYRIDPEPFRIALAQADAALASARLQVSEMRSGYAGKGAGVSGKREAVGYATLDLQRQADLLKAGFTTRARWEQAQHALSQARSDLASAQADEAQARAGLSNQASGPVDRHPLVLAAAAMRDKAALDLRRTDVRAPVAGLASQTMKVQPGQIVALGIPTMSLLISDRGWVEANFKETDLEHMHIGQKATIKLDAYPSVPIAAHVESIGAGTGSEFSVLPAQNATGNWVKVTQRVPVRIAIDGKPGVPLIAGLSAHVTVDLK